MDMTKNKGFTMIELVAVIVIVAVLVAIAVGKFAPIETSIRTEESMLEMDKLTIAIVGNPELQSNGILTDFGYVGDIGALPPDLDALISNPGSYSTWNGPYLQNSFVQAGDDFKQDAWQTDYIYSGGVTITSTGSGDNIVRRLAGSGDDLLRNRISGNIFDLDGTPPGNDYKDSIQIRLTVPNGVGGLTTKTVTPDPGGYFDFDSIPIGNHPIELIYTPDNDTLIRLVSITPGSNQYGQYYLATNSWSFSGGGTGIAKIAGSDSLVADCHGFYFWIENTTGADIIVDSVKLIWSPSSSYYRYVIWDGTIVFDRNNPKAGSGETVVFSTSQTILEGQSMRVDFDFFKDSPTGGSDVDMNNLNFTVEFSDGSTIAVTTGNCP